MQRAVLHFFLLPSHLHRRLKKFSSFLLSHKRRSEFMFIHKWKKGRAWRNNLQFYSAKLFPSTLVIFLQPLTSCHSCHSCHSCSWECENGFEEAKKTFFFHDIALDDDDNAPVTVEWLEKSSFNCFNKLLSCLFSLVEFSKVIKFRVVISLWIETLSNFFKSHLKIDKFNLKT